MKFTGSIGKYKLGPVIGEGAFAKVKRAMHSVTDQQVAIKIIDKRMIIKHNLIHQVIIF